MASKDFNVVNTHTEFAKPKKALGQNFLQDPNITRKIVAALNVQQDDMVVEVGPGRGALTEHLLAQTNNLHLIEFDRELAAYWQAYSETVANLAVYSADILKFDFASLPHTSKTKAAKIKVIGNLPYNISSPILFYLMAHISQIDSIVVMLQKEVVQRMVAEPGSKQYGRLSVMLQQYFAIELLFTVPPTAFFPPPKVDSAIARLQPLNEPIHPVENQQHFADVVKQAFSQRRKTLRNTLKPLLSFEQIASLGIDPQARAETLSITDFAKLANLLTENS